jgi:hypothetical protein
MLFSVFALIIMAFSFTSCKKDVGGGGAGPGYGLR